MRTRFVFFAVPVLALLTLGTGCTATRAGLDESKLAPEDFRVAEGATARPAILAQDAEPGSMRALKHRVNALAGYTSERGGGGFSLGAQYEYLWKEKIGLGGFVDLTFADDFSTAIGAAAYWHPVDNLTLIAGPGVGLSGDTEPFLRVGGMYDFPWKDYLISPYFSVDVFADDTPLFFAVAVGRKF